MPLLPELTTVGEFLANSLRSAKSKSTTPSLKIPQRQYLREPVGTGHGYILPQARSVPIKLEFLVKQVSFNPSKFG